MSELTYTKSDSGILDLEEDRLREECGVFGIFNHPDAAAITALGLHALQHRGQEAAGIVSFDGKRFHSERRNRRGIRVAEHAEDAALLTQPVTIKGVRVRSFDLVAHRASKPCLTKPSLTTPSPTTSSLSPIP